MSTSTFLNDVAQLYLHCESYRDSGLVKSEDRINKVSQTGEFKTEFKRHEYFHFEWTNVEQEKTLVLHSDKESTVLTSSSGWTDKSDSLELGISSLFGATQGVAYLVPTLLLPTLLPGNPRIVSMKNMVISESETDSMVRVDGVMTGDKYQLWFDQNTHALSRCLISTIMSKEANAAAMKELSVELAKQNISTPAGEALSTLVEIVYSKVSIEPYLVPAT